MQIIWLHFHQIIENNCKNRSKRHSRYIAIKNLCGYVEILFLVKHKQFCRKLTLSQQDAPMLRRSSNSFSQSPAQRPRNICRARCLICQIPRANPHTNRHINQHTNPHITHLSSPGNQTLLLRSCRHNSSWNAPKPRLKREKTLSCHKQSRQRQ